MGHILARVRTPELMIDRCPVCHSEVSATTKRSLRAALSEHKTYHEAQVADDREREIMRLAIHA